MLGLIPFPAYTDKHMNTNESSAVVDFWRDAGPARWFRKDEAFDRAFGARFLDLHMAAARRQFDAWEDTGYGVLALLILLDQFPRHTFRVPAQLYATAPPAPPPPPPPD